MAAYRYWRINISANDGSTAYTSMGEVELFEGATNRLIMGSGFSSSSFFGGNTAQLLFDGDLNQEWVTANGQPLPSWVAFDLGVARDISSYSLRSQHATNGRNPTAWELQGNDESMLPGAPWVTVDRRAGETVWDLQERRVFGIYDVPGDPYFSSVTLLLHADGVTPPGPFNAADASAGVSISGGGSIATGPGGSAVRGVSPKSSGVLQFEVTCLAGGDSARNLIGVGLSSMGLYDPGADQNGWTYYGTGGQKYNGGALVPYGASYGGGAVVGVVVNFSSGTLSFWVDGVSQGVAFTGLPGGLFPVWGVGSNAFSAISARLNTGATAFAYPIPGASPWEPHWLIDSSPAAQVPSIITDVSIQTGSPMAGPGYLKGSSSASLLQYPSSDAFDFRDPYTIEFFIRVDAPVAGARFLMTKSASSYMVVDGNTLTVVNMALTGDAAALTTGVRHHIAITRDQAGVGRLFRDGVMLSGAGSGLTYGPEPFAVFGIPGRPDLSSFNGSIDELRITQGFARYTANFTAPTGPFPDAATVTNNAPVLASVPARSSPTGSPDSVPLSATDANGDTVTYSATGLPPGMAINTATGAITGVPTTAGSYPVSAQASDGSLLSNTVNFTWTITTPSSGPVYDRQNRGGSTTRATKIPAIPAPTEHNLLHVAKALKEVVESRTGTRGDPLDAMVTKRDLLSGDFRDDFDIPGSEVISLVPPPAPTGFLVTAVLVSVFLEWDAHPASYGNHAFTEVWRSSTDALGSAVMVGTTNTRFYVDAVGSTSSGYYYWVRFVSTAAISGPFNDTNGTFGRTGVINGVDLNPLIITADKLAAGALEGVNLIENGTAELGLAGWIADGASSGGGTFAVDTASPHAGAQSFRLVKSAPGATAGAAATAFQVIPGETYAIRMAIRGSADGSAVVRVNEGASEPVGDFMTAALRASFTDMEGVVVTTGWTILELRYTAPAGVSWVSLAILADEDSMTTVWFDTVSMGRAITAASIAAGTIAVGSAAIANAAIRNALIADLAVDDAKIANLHAAKITAGFIDADRIEVGSLDAKLANIDAAVIGVGIINQARIGAASITSAKIYEIIFSDDFDGVYSPSSPFLPGDSDYGNVVLLLHGDGPNGSTTFIDNSPAARTPSNLFDVIVSDAFPIVGSGSIKAGTLAGSILEYASSTDFNLRSVFTLEFRIRSLGDSGFLMSRSASSYAQVSGSSLTFTNMGGSNPTIPLLPGVTHSIALVGESASVFKVYRDGFEIESGVPVVDLSSTPFAVVGVPSRPDLQAFTGFIDEVRFTQGVARYTGDYTPSTAAFPDGLTIPGTPSDFSSFGTAGWAISKNGTAVFNNLYSRGSISSGGFAINSWAWPAPGQGGYFLGSQGLRLGNEGDGAFFEVTEAGNVRAPGFSLNSSGITVTSGILRNVSNTSFVNLNAVGSQDFLRVAGGAVRITADGNAYFGATVVPLTSWYGSAELIESVTVATPGDKSFGTTTYLKVAEVFVYINTGVVTNISEALDRSYSARATVQAGTANGSGSPGNLAEVVLIDATVAIAVPMFWGSSSEAPGQNPYGFGKAAIYVVCKLRLRPEYAGSLTSFTVTQIGYILDRIS